MWLLFHDPSQSLGGALKAKLLGSFAVMHLGVGNVVFLNYVF